MPSINPTLVVFEKSASRAPSPARYNCTEVRAVMLQVVLAVTQESSGEVFWPHQLMLQLVSAQTGAAALLALKPSKAGSATFKLTPAAIEHAIGTQVNIH